MRRVVLWAIVALAYPAHAEDIITLHDSFVNGEQFLALAEGSQSTYAMGVIDGLLGAPMLGAPSKGLADQIGHCIEGMTSVQVAAIIRKYLNDHPERWHNSMHTLTYEALQRSCSLKRQ